MSTNKKFSSRVKRTDNKFEQSQKKNKKEHKKEWRPKYNNNLEKKETISMFLSTCD